MKKILFLAITLVTANCTLLAQDVIYGGFKIAPNLSVFTDKAPADTKSGIGYGIGYYEVLELSYKVNLQAEVNYNMMSFVKEVKSGSNSNKEVRAYRAIELPLMIKLRPSSNFSIGAGYQFSFRPKLKTTKTDKTGSTTNETTVESKGIKTSGFFLDMNGKVSKNIIGLRVLSPSEDFNGGSKSLNVAAYFGITLF